MIVDGAALTLGLRLYEETPGIGSFDAVLCAVVITTGAEAVVSADRAFGTVKGVRHLDPASTEFRSWLDAADPRRADAE